MLLIVGRTDVSEVSLSTYSYVWHGEAFSGGAGKVRGLTPGATASYQPVEAGMSVPMQFASSSFANQGFAAKMNKDGMEAFAAAPSMDLYAGKNIAGKIMEHEGTSLPIPNKLNQVFFLFILSCFFN